MAEGSAARLARGHATICIPIEEEEYQGIVERAEAFRRWLDGWFAEARELFPEGLARGYGMKDGRTSAKQGVSIRRIVLRDGWSYSIRPSFLLPSMTARTEEVEGPLFLRKFGVPFWALAHVFGENPTHWYCLEIGLGRNSLVGTTVRAGKLPEDLLADEHHPPRDGQKNYIATTVGGGCVRGAALSQDAGTDELKPAYGAFKEEARNVNRQYAPKTVNTDGWPSTQAAWKALFPLVVILQCFLHAWLKIRDRAKHLGEILFDLSRRVWDAYQAPEAHRTSNMLDRLMRSMNRYFDRGQHLHGSRDTRHQRCRAWALLHHFASWHPATTKDNEGWQSPAENASTVTATTQTGSPTSSSPPPLSARTLRQPG